MSSRTVNCGFYLWKGSRPCFPTLMAIDSGFVLRGLYLRVILKRHRLRLLQRQGRSGLTRLLCRHPHGAKHDQNQR